MSLLDTLIYGYRTILAAGVEVTRRNKVNFKGAGVSVADNPTTGMTDVTIAGGGGSLPTGTGFVTVTSGAYDAASKPYAAGALTFLATPSSANLRSMITDETGVGLAVFNDSPTFTTPRINNPALTAQYVFAGSAIASTKTITLPLLTAGDVFMFEAFIQTMTNKTLVLASNTVTDTSAAVGDIMRHNGTRFVRLARGTANQLLQVNAGGTDIAWATVASGALGTNVASGTNFISIGVNPAAAGGLRMANALGISSRNAANSADFNLCNVDGANQINVGDAGTNMNIVGTAIQLVSSGNVYLYSASAQALNDDGTTMSIAHPIVGLATPNGSVDAQTVVAVGGSNITLTSAQYNTKVQKFTGALAASRTITYPAPVDDAHAYVKIIWGQTTGFGVTITTGAGLTVLTVVTDAPHVLLFTTAGVVKIT